ncbi:MAG: substrate-binding domain-containing protein [Nitrospirae bacterium]|uniref:substrate-binding domain-containing protein n=1 Tax=Candidatus Magnetobacterium casense TaxID=1455061 RepID=UPI0005906A89|nr:substrate-binding domain-containing protein [Candidatus Magnetobacterium casensis]MBF0336623.1 substrate-binding domain-containing protein [Nitrospirota bacterium]
MARSRDKAVITALLVVFCVIPLGCYKQPAEPLKKDAQRLRLATSSTTVESGLLDRLIPVFERKYGISVDIIMVGSGASLDLARNGKADVVLVHSREAEDKFVSDGYGINRMDVMYNDFVILGPPDDPLHLKGETDALTAMKAIYDKEATFVSRGDKSGTYAREKILWTMLKLKPSGKWYIQARKDILTALRTASERKAYILSDRSTYLFNREELNLVVVVEADKKLFNPYGVIAVNPTKVSGVNYEGAMKFINFITSTDGQEIICFYGKMRFGKPLFVPLAVKNSICQ